MQKYTFFHTISPKWIRLGFLVRPCSNCKCVDPTQGRSIFDTDYEHDAYPSRILFLLKKLLL
jgi:hypothetical protein